MNTIVFSDEVPPPKRILNVSSIENLAYPRLMLASTVTSRMAAQTAMIVTFLLATRALWASFLRRTSSAVMLYLSGVMRTPSASSPDTGRTGRRSAR